MRLGLGLGGLVPVSAVAELARRAEQEGFDSLWIHETFWQRDAVVPLAAAAGATRTLRLGAGCLSPLVRHPALLAQTAATLQEASGGRFVLALGTGFPARLDMMGVAHGAPAAAVGEAMEIVRRLLRGEAVTHAGRHFALRGVRLQWAGPLPDPPPIYVAGWRPRMLALAAARADGYLARPMEPPVMLRRRLDAIARVAQARGRDLGGFEVAGYVLCAIGDDEASCLEALRHDPFVVYQVAVLDDDVAGALGVEPERLRGLREAYWAGELGRAAGHISREILASMALFGTPAAALEQLHAYTAAGMSLPVLQPVSAEPRMMEGLWRLARLAARELPRPSGASL